MGIFQLLLRSTCLILLFVEVISTPPGDPIKCTSTNTNCTITNCYGSFPDRSICQAANVAYPTTEAELISLVANATKAKRKMKVATRFSSSIPKLVCPDGEDGLLISTNNLNHVLSIDVESMTMTIESGVTLRQIIKEGANAGLALPYAPYWWGITIGGLLSTGAHGSTLIGNGSSVHDYVKEMTIVSPGGPKNGYVNVRTLDERNNELNAAKVSLGVLGVISKVTLKLQPLFKRSITYERKTDTDLGDQAVRFGRQYEFGDITWFPSQQNAIYRIDHRISSNTPGNGVYDSIGFRSTGSFSLSLIRTNEEKQESSRDAKGRCTTALITSTVLRLQAFGLTNSEGYPVIGYQNLLQSSGSCLDSPKDGLKTACPWDPRVNGIFFHQTTVSIGLSDVKSFIQDVQELIKLEPKALCVVEQYNGVLMRYVKASSAYLGHQEDAIDFDFTYYRSKDPMTPRLYQDILEEIEQIAVFKYGGLPHWGKNRNVAFDGVIKKYKNANVFLSVKQMYDPMGLFSSEWTDQVLGLKGRVIIVKKGCALEGLCICSEDIHCAPEKGYFCRNGKVYKDARVCTFVSSKKN